MTKYRSQIRLSIQDLIITRRNILDSIENIVLQMDLDSSNEGEEFHEIKHFREIDDKNIKRLIRIYDSITLEISNMMMDNDFTYNEVGFDTI